MPHGPKESARKRRRGLTASQVLRSLVLMRAKNSDYRELRERTADGVTLRQFTDFYCDPVPKHDVFNRGFTRLTPQTLKVKISWFKVRSGLVWRTAPRSRRHRAGRPESARVAAGRLFFQTDCPKLNATFSLNGSRRHCVFDLDEPNAFDEGSPPHDSKTDAMLGLEPVASPITLRAMELRNGDLLRCR
jgi:hypothetical protein